MSEMKLSKNQIMFKDNIIGYADGEPRLLASRCSHCGKVFFPRREICTECFEENLEDVFLNGEAEIHVFTVVNIGVKGFKTPYILAWLTFDEGVRLVAQLEFDPAEADKLYIGQKARLVVGTLRVLDDGTEVLGYKFVPVL